MDDFQERIKVSFSDDGQSSDDANFLFDDGDEDPISGLSDIILSPGVDASAFLDRPQVPEAIRTLAMQSNDWDFLEQGGYNCVSRSVSSHPYLSEDEPRVLVKKSSFPQINVLLYRTELHIVTIQQGRRYYSCLVSSTGTALQRTAKPAGPVMQLEKGRKLIFILNGTGLYQVFISTYQVGIVSVDGLQLSVVEQIISTDPRASTQSYFQLTSQSITQIQQVCPTFCAEFDPAPAANNQKMRSARLFADFYPKLQVYAIDDATLVMPYLDQSATVDDIIKEAIRIFIMHHRIIADMCIVKNFKKDQDGNVYCVDPDMAFSATNRNLSRGSLLIQTGIVYALTAPNQWNAYRQFLQNEMHQRTDAERRLVVVTLGLLALFENIENLREIPADWINENWLQSVFKFDSLKFSLEMSDLNVIHLFGDLIHTICLAPQSHLTGYHIYYDCIWTLVQQSDARNLRLFLETLSDEIVTELLNMQVFTTLLSASVQTNNLELVNIFLEFDVDPLLQDEGGDGYHALDWAILHGNWEMVPNLLKKKAGRSSEAPLARRYTLWADRQIRIPLPFDEVVVAMRALDESTQFHLHLQTMKTLALPSNSRTHLDLVYTLISYCAQYFMNQDEDLTHRKKIFIRNCDRALRQRLPIFEEQTTTNAMQRTISELKNTLSLARDPTSGCTIA